MMLHSHPTPSAELMWWFARRLESRWFELFHDPVQGEVRAPTWPDLHELQSTLVLEATRATVGKAPRIGLGAIHSLLEGEVILAPPLFYGREEEGGDVVVGIAEFGVYGTGPTETDAVFELKEVLEHLYRDLMEATEHELTRPLRSAKARLQQGTRVHA